jgi:hypothetical protein
VEALATGSERRGEIGEPDREEEEWRGCWKADFVFSLYFTDAKGYRRAVGVALISFLLLMSHGV